MWCRLETEENLWEIVESETKINGTQIKCGVGYSTHLYSQTEKIELTETDCIWRNEYIHDSHIMCTTVNQSWDDAYTIHGYTGTRFIYIMCWIIATAFSFSSSTFFCISCAESDIKWIKWMKRCICLVPFICVYIFQSLGSLLVCLLHLSYYSNENEKDVQEKEEEENDEYETDEKKIKAFQFYFSFEFHAYSSLKCEYIAMECYLLSHMCNSDIQ